MAGQLGLVQVENNQDLERREKAEMARIAEIAQSDPVITGLSKYVLDCWEAARTAKHTHVKDRMLDCLRARVGEYSAEELAQIRKTSNTVVYMMLTDEKCAAAEAWIEDFLFQAGDKPWGQDPTPVPDLSGEHTQDVMNQLYGETMADVDAGLAVTPEDVKARAQELVKEMNEKLFKYAKEIDDRQERVMEDVLEEGGWYDALHAAIPDIVGNLGGIIKGPVLRKERTLKWEEDKPVMGWEIKPKFEARSPFNIYPGPSGTCIEDTYICDVYDYAPQDLYNLIGVPGFDEWAIRQILQHWDGFKDWLWISETERDRLEGRPFNWSDPAGKIQALNFWGDVQGSWLITHGVPESDIEDPEALYPAEVWQIGRYVIKAELNGSPLGKKPYHMAGWRKIPGAFWYRGLPEILKDIQRICNMTAISLCNNMMIASGPMLWADVSSLADGANVTQLFPWKVFQFDMKDSHSVNRQPMGFFQPNLNTEQLLRVYEYFNKEAENKSVPSYAYGGDSAKTGPLGTATGFSMMMGNASKGIKKVIRNIDKGIVEPSVKMTHVYLMLFFPEKGLKGDTKIVARGTSALVAREQKQMRLQEALNIILKSPQALGLVGEVGLAEVLRKVFDGLDVDDVIPQEDEILRRISQQTQANMMNQPALPPGGQPGSGGQQVNPAGAPVGGQDVATFSQGGPGAP